MNDSLKSGGVWRRGRGVRSPDPYLLGSLFEAQNQKSRGGPEWPSGMRLGVVWGGHPPPPPPGPARLAHKALTLTASPREPHVPEVVEVRIAHLDAPKLFAVRLDIGRVAHDDERDLVHDHGLRRRVQRLALFERRRL